MHDMEDMEGMMHEHYADMEDDGYGDEGMSEGDMVTFHSNLRL